MLSIVDSTSGDPAGLKRRFLLALLILFPGLAWNLCHSGGPVPAEATSGGAASSGAPLETEAEQRLQWMNPPGGGGTAAFSLDHWGQGASQLGISFSLAMLLGSMVRAAVKTGVTVLALLSVGLYFMERDSLQPFLESTSEVVREGEVWLGARMEGFLGWFQRHLPSSLAAAVGFGFGLRK